MMPMIATTISNSIRVKPFWPRFRLSLEIMCLAPFAFGYETKALFDAFSVRRLKEQLSCQKKNRLRIAPVGGLRSAEPSNIDSRGVGSRQPAIATTAFL
jgi:hypothetical protein